MTAGPWHRVRNCAGCGQPVTRCTHRACLFLGFVHLRSNLHRCGKSGRAHARVRGVS